jgi:hypothetical protein
MLSISTPRRRGLGVLLIGALLCGLLAPGFRPALAASATPGFSGLVLDPDGKPAEGYSLVFRGEDGAEHVAPPSDDLGRYEIELEPGSYQLIAATAPDGTRLDVPALPALPVEWGARRLDIRIGQPTGAPPAAGAASGATEGTAPSKAPKTRSGQGIPWVQIGAAAGSALLLGLVVWGSGDDDEQSASPYLPGTAR